MTNKRMDLVKGLVSAVHEGDRMITHQDSQTAGMDSKIHSVQKYRVKEELGC